MNCPLRQFNGFEDINILNISKILLKFVIYSKFLNVSFSEFNDHYWPTIVLEISYLAELLRQKMVLEYFFTAKSGNLSFKFKFCSYQFFFLFDLITNKVNLKVAESNTIVENIPSSLSLSLSLDVSFLLFLVRI